MYIYAYLNTYSLVNIVNDLFKKKKKSLLIIGMTPLIMKYFSFILSQAAKTKDSGFSLIFFTI